MSAETSIFQQLTFSEQTQQLKSFIVDYITHHEPEVADSIAETVDNSSALLRVMCDAFSAYLIERTRIMNLEAGELFRTSVKTDKGVDRLVSNAGLKRSVITPATSTQAAVMESNEHLLLRYDLSHYQLNATGTSYGYKFHALSFSADERPRVTVERVSNQVIQTFTFDESSGSANIADAEFKCIEKGTGKVIGAITPVQGNTIDFNGLSAYLNRHDIAQETDKLTLQESVKRSYRVTVNVYTNDDPRHAVNKDDIQKALTSVTQSKRRNSARVSDLDFSYPAKKLGAYDVDVIGFDEPLQCEWNEYAECEELILNVMGKRTTKRDS